MQIIGLGFHYLGRAITLTYFRYASWTLESYLSRKSKKCGSVKIAGPGRFTNVSGLEIGKNVHINFGAYWVCEGGLSIGDNTIFAKGVTIYTRNHNYAGTELPFDHSNTFKRVTIGKNVWVGTNVTILPGVKIDDGAIIGAGAVVVGHVPEGAIYGAHPAHNIGTRDMAHYKELEAAKAYHTPHYIPRPK